MRGRTVDQPLALLVIDLDRFKEVNDSLGHHVGDNLLRQLGPRFHHGIQQDAIVARLGGDEFAVVLDGASEADAIATAEEVLRALEDPFVLDGVPVRISASIGIALFPEHADEPNGLLQHADVAMYRSKRGHSGPSVYLPAHDEHTKERLRSIHELRRFIEEGRLVVHYQPQVDTASGDIIGAEALVRLQHPTRGLVPPDEFLPLAEQAGLMRSLTTNVLSQVLDEMVIWRERDVDNIKVAVNLSITNLLDVGFPQEVAIALESRRLDAKRLIFEVTEGTMLSDVDRALDAAASLRSLGAELSIDDYGTGYASLAYLRRFPLDELKLDRSFVANLETDETARTFVRSAIEIAHALGIRVVAEGIETQEIWNAINDAGGDVCQGYFFSRPLPADVFFESIIKNESAGHPMSAKPIEERGSHFRLGVS